MSYKELLVLTGDYNLIDNYIFFRESTNALSGETDNKRFAVVNQVNDQIKYYSIKYLVKWTLENLV